MKTINNTSTNSIVCFGEVLWDNLPTGKKLGGAPLNLALRAQSFGNQTTVISSIGTDTLGKEILEVIKKHDANIEHIQESKEYVTSEVLVSLNEEGIASYEIKKPCAWDDIALKQEDIELVKNSDAFIFGSLVARSETSYKTLSALLPHGKYNVFDVNLRPPHYTLELLISLMQYANFTKFNDEELIEISNAMGCNSYDIEECIDFISKETNTNSICVTLGSKGAVLSHNGIIYKNNGYKITVADTVGAGDSFLATIISSLLLGVSPQQSIDKACAVGAIVASKNGANPIVSEEEITEIMLS